MGLPGEAWGSRGADGGAGAAKPAATSEAAPGRRCRGLAGVVLAHSQRVVAAAGNVQHAAPVHRLRARQARRRAASRGAAAAAGWQQASCRTAGGLRRGRRWRAASLLARPTAELQGRQRGSSHKGAAAAAVAAAALTCTSCGAGWSSRWAAPRPSCPCRPLPQLSSLQRCPPSTSWCPGPSLLATTATWCEPQATCSAKCPYRAPSTCIGTLAPSQGWCFSLERAAPVAPICSGQGTTCPSAAGVVQQALAQHPGPVVGLGGAGGQWPGAEQRDSPPSTHAHTQVTALACTPAALGGASCHLQHQYTPLHAGCQAAPPRPPPTCSTRPSTVTTTVRLSPHAT
jgi:hypothetical protein